MPTVQVNDIQMYYELRGEGQLLVLILGLAIDVSEVEQIIRWFAERYRVLAFDNRGAGRTDKPDIPYTIEMMASDTIGLMDAVGIARKCPRYLDGRTHRAGVDAGAPGTS